MAVVTVTAISGVRTVPLHRLMRFGVIRKTLDIDWLFLRQCSPAAGKGIDNAKDVRRICVTSFNFRYRQTP